MNIKLKDEYEIYMYYRGKQENMSDDDIESSVELLRVIRKIGKK